MTLAIALAVIAAILLLHWLVSRSRFYAFALISLVAWLIGSIAYMLCTHSLDTRGIAASLGGTIFLFATWSSGVDHYKKKSDPSAVN